MSEKDETLKTIWEFTCFVLTPVNICNSFKTTLRFFFFLNGNILI